MDTPFAKKLFPWSSAGRKAKRVYMFSEGSAGDTNLLGLKGSNLSDMFRMDLPVPPGFIIASESAREFAAASSAKETEKFMEEYRKAIKELEKQTGKRFGGVTETPSVTASAATPKKEALPLLLSVRASPAIHMPGVIGAVLNIGINDELIAKLAASAENPRWALDTYCRFLQMFGTMVFGVDEKKYKLILANERVRAGVGHDSELGPAHLQNVIAEFKRLANVPQDVWEQLHLAVNSVYKSWYSFKADKYREIYGVTEDLGVAIVVQSMVFGNLSNRCGVGCAFTRNPNTGDTEYVADFAKCTGGEDLFSSAGEIMSMDNLRSEMPALGQNLSQVMLLLEKHYKDLQEIQFTVEEGNLYILQATSATRSAQAAIKIAVSMVNEKLISEREALMRLDPVQMMHCNLPQILPEFTDPHHKEASKQLIGKGRCAAVGTASGKVVFTSQEAINCRRTNEPCILCLHETSTDDIEGLEAASGVITTRGAMSSNAANWMRGSARPYVCGVQNIGIDPKARQLLCVDTGGKVTSGETITIDGASGCIFFDAVPTTYLRPSEEYITLLTWARKYKAMNILAGADTVEDVNDAFIAGADGIGVFRTERLFLAPGRIELTRSILLTDNDSERAAALAKLLELQKEDLLSVFKAVGDRDVVVRLLDCSLNGALPSPRDSNYNEVVRELCSSLNITREVCEQRINALYESNPILGVRGCRLAFIQPFFASLQAKAIAKATLIARREGSKVNTKVLLPVAFSDREVDRVLPTVMEAMKDTFAQGIVGADIKDLKIDIEFGAEIANPRGCLRADRFVLNKNISCLSFDSDSLTELALGVTKEQSARYMPLYVDKQIVSRDPFTCIDATAVGKLIEIAVESARKQRSDIKFNVYGMHTADPLSVRFFNAIGVDTLSVINKDWLPVATIAAAQSSIHPQQMRVNRFANPVFV